MACIDKFDQDPERIPLEVLRGRRGHLEAVASCRTVLMKVVVARV